MAGHSSKGEAPFVTLNDFQGGGNKAVVALLQCAHAI